MLVVDRLRQRDPLHERLQALLGRGRLPCGHVQRSCVVKALLGQAQLDATSSRPLSRALVASGAQSCRNRGFRLRWVGVERVARLGVVGGRGRRCEPSRSRGLPTFTRMKTCSAQCKRHRMQHGLDDRQQATRSTQPCGTMPAATSESRRSRGGEACWASAGGQAASSACAAGGATRLGRPRSTSLRLRCPERHGSWGTSGSGVLRRVP